MLYEIQNEIQNEQTNLHVIKLRQMVMSGGYKGTFRKMSDVFVLMAVTWVCTYVIVLSFIFRRYVFTACISIFVISIKISKT